MLNQQGLSNQGLKRTNVKNIFNEKKRLLSVLLVEIKD